MFGSLRFALAFLVVVSHLAPAPETAHLGYYAVRVFFVLSGYVVTHALNETYRFEAGRFWANRLLKLLPPYWLACGATLALLAAAPRAAAEFLPYWNHELAWRPVVLNLLVAPLQFKEPALRLVPPSWSLPVELAQYLALSVFVARRPRNALIALAIGVAYHLACFEQDLGWESRYFPAPAAALSFSVGALLWFGVRSGLAAMGPVWTAPCLALWVANLCAGSFLPDSYDFGWGYYLNVTFAAAVVLSLTEIQAGPVFARLDRALGGLAYPIFLLHWLAAFAVHLAFPDMPMRGWVFLSLAVPVLLVGAFALFALEQALVEPLRSRIRRERTQEPCPADPDSIPLRAAAA